MIHSILIIDGESGISLLEYHNKSKSKAFSDFFQAINHIVDDIRESLQEERELTDHTRLLMVDANSITIHYSKNGKFLMCALADTDDNNNKILQALQTLSRRFWAKHQIDIDHFRFSSEKDVFAPFIVDIEIFTMKGAIAESFPKLIVTDATLQRLMQMSMINSIELSIAKLCQGTTSAMQISTQMNVPYENITEALKKLSTLDILKY